jgi:RimJ/RimL family protein N-acetyltransferase
MGAASGRTSSRADTRDSAVPPSSGYVLASHPHLSYRHPVTYRYWPFFDLHLATPDLTLRPMREADLAAMSDLLPEDLELDPEVTRYQVNDERLSRGIVTHQGYWKAYGTWRPSAWRLGFVVSAAGEMIGFQELEGNDFALLRTVDTSSYLIQSARGRGYGNQMRRAVLALAFGPLRAHAAITSAWHDNHASLGVSRALGYQPNGELLHARRDGADVMVHMRLRRQDYLARPRRRYCDRGFRRLPILVRAVTDQLEIHWRLTERSWKRGTAATRYRRKGRTEAGGPSVAGVPHFSERLPRSGIPEVGLIMIGEQSGAAPFRNSMIETCWMCGIRLRVDQLVPDGGSACPDVRWYCRDTRGCTQRWTTRLNGVPDVGEAIARASAAPRSIAG